MNDLLEGIGLDETSDLPSPEVINDQSNSIYTGSINGTSNSFDNSFRLTDETKRFLFIIIVTITILICLIIFISIFICICFNRRRNLKRQEKKDHHLLPEQSEKISCNKKYSTDSLRKTIYSNGKQQVDKKVSSSSIQQSSTNIIIEKPSIRPFYYDNLDDIPFIDDSRPTSYIDITRV